MLEWIPVPQHTVQEVRRIVAGILSMPVQDLRVCVQYNDGEQGLYGVHLFQLNLDQGTLSQNGLREGLFIIFFFVLVTAAGPSNSRRTIRTLLLPEHSNG